MTVAGRPIDEVVALQLKDAEEFFSDDRARRSASEQIAEKMLKEIRDRLGFLDAVGVGYLTLDRSAATLSGGESQRIRLATQIGSKLMGVLYVLDEPSIGLHQRDNRKLLDTLLELRDLGNTVHRRRARRGDDPRRRLRHRPRPARRRARRRDRGRGDARSRSRRSRRR